MEKLAERLKSILMGIEKEGHSIDEHTVLIKELKSIIKAVEESKCSSGDFCGMDKKW